MLFKAALSDEISLDGRAFFTLDIVSPSRDLPAHSVSQRLIRKHHAHVRNSSSRTRDMRRLHELRQISSLKHLAFQARVARIQILDEEGHLSHR